MLPESLVPSGSSRPRARHEGEESMSIAITAQRVHIEFSRVQTWSSELRLSQDLTLYLQGGR